MRSNGRIEKENCQRRKGGPERRRRRRRVLACLNEGSDRLTKFSESEMVTFEERNLGIEEGEF